MKNRLPQIAIGCAAAAIAAGAVVATGMLRQPARPAVNPDGAQTILLTPDAAGHGTATVQSEQGFYDAPSFKLIDQTGATFDSARLKGKTWVAMLFFTECKAACPMMAGRMRDIQAAVNDPNVELVSITVDPVRDTPEVLAAYAKKYNADGRRWFFLTGTQEQVIAAADGLKLNAEGPTPGSPAGHSEKFLLIDPAGRVRGIYSTNDDASMKQLAIDAAKLATK